MTGVFPVSHLSQTPQAPAKAQHEDRHRRWLKGQKAQAHCFVRATTVAMCDSRYTDPSSKVLQTVIASRVLGKPRKRAHHSGHDDDGQESLQDRKHQHDPRKYSHVFLLLLYNSIVYIYIPYIYILCIFYVYRFSWVWFGAAADKNAWALFGLKIAE